MSVCILFIFEEYFSFGLVHLNDIMIPHGFNANTIIWSYYFGKHINISNGYFWDLTFVCLRNSLLMEYIFRGYA